MATLRQANGLHIALLRGINVGGKNKLRMKELADLFVSAGCRDVRTYIQSGNVVFAATGTVAKRLPIVIPKAIADRFGLRVPVVTRTAEEIRDVSRHNPFLKSCADTDPLAVAFLAARPAATAVASLDADRSPPDAFVVRGREVYLHLPNGTARSKLTNAYLDSCLKTTSTVRNWRTVLKLVEMIGEAPISPSARRRASRANR